MTTSFDPTQGPIIIQVQIWGPTGNAVVNLALDTGATSTIIRTSVLQFVGYDPALATEHRRMTSVTGIEIMPRLAIDKIEALGQERLSFPVIAHTLPPTAPVDGLLGLDFLRSQRLVVDFRAGQIELA